LANITITTAATWIDEVWSPELNTAVEFNIVIAGLFADKSSLMMHGDVFHLPAVHNLTANDKSASTDLTPEAITEGDQTFSTWKHKATAFFIEDIAEVQSTYSIREAYTSRSGYALARIMDSDGAAIIDDNTTNTVGTVGTELTDANLRTAWKLLADSNAPSSPRYMVVAPATYASFLGMDKFVARTYVGEESLTAVRQAKVGNIYGAEIYISQLTVGTAPNSDGAMWADDHFFKIVQRAPTPHSEYRALSVGWAIVMDTIYQVAEREEAVEAAAGTTTSKLWGVRLRSIK
jgi:hypothetical protein